MNQWKILKREPAEPEELSPQEVFEKALTRELKKNLAQMSKSDRELLLSAAKRARVEKAQKGPTRLEELPRREREVESTGLLVERRDGSMKRYGDNSLVEKDRREPKRPSFANIINQRAWTGQKYDDR